MRGSKGDGVFGHPPPWKNSKLNLHLKLQLTKKASETPSPPPPFTKNNFAPPPSHGLRPIFGNFTL